MLIAERFLSSLINKYGKHHISRLTMVIGIHKQRFLKLGHHLQSFFEKNTIERTMQYIKDRIEGSDHYFTCKKNKCRLNTLNNELTHSLINAIKK